MNSLLWYYYSRVGRLLTIIEDVVYHFGIGPARRGCGYVLFVRVGGRVCPCDVAFSLYHNLCLDDGRHSRHAVCECGGGG